MVTRFQFFKMAIRYIERGKVIPALSILLKDEERHELENE